jgi:hypothetical protein
MTVNITISGESGGTSLSDVQDVGEISPGATSDAQDLYIRHDAVNFPITDCAFYLVRYSGTGYSGSDPDADYTEVIGWGDDSGSESHGGGGLYLNQDYDDSFPVGSYYCFRSGYGADANCGIELQDDAINNVGTGAATDGEIPVEGEAFVKVRLDVPDTASAAGDRFIQLVMAYSYTS